MPTPLSGDPVLASDIIIPKFIRKQVAEVVNNSVTYQNDDELLVTLPVGNYRVEAFLHYTQVVAAASTPEIKFQWTFSGTVASGVLTAVGIPNAGTSNSNSSIRHSGHAWNTSISFGGATAGTNVAHEDLELEISVAGVLQLQWAQNILSANNTTVTTQSRIYITELEAP